jgi:hypothetical protein
MKDQRQLLTIAALLGMGALVVYKLYRKPGIKVITLKEFKEL